MACATFAAAVWLVAIPLGDLAKAPICHVSLDKAEPSYKSAPKQSFGIRISWVCTVDSTNAFCHVPSSDGVGSSCVCCWEGKCYSGTVTGRS